MHSKRNFLRRILDALRQNHHYEALLDPSDSDENLKADPSSQALLPVNCNSGAVTDPARQAAKVTYQASGSTTTPPAGQGSSSSSGFDLGNAARHRITTNRINGEHNVVINSRRGTARNSFRNITVTAINGVTTTYEGPSSRGYSEIMGTDSSNGNDRVVHNTIIAGPGGSYTTTTSVTDHNGTRETRTYHPSGSSYFHPCTADQSAFNTDSTVTMGPNGIEVASRSHQYDYDSPTTTLSRGPGGSLTETSVTMDHSGMRKTVRKYDGEARGAYTESSIIMDHNGIRKTKRRGHD